MTVQITIIGLGQIGASVGLALQAYKDQLTTVGHDKSPEVARLARQLGAVDKIHYNLPAAVEGADIILLAVPVDQVHATLKLVAESMRAEAVLMETSPVKAAVAAWTKELLPPDRHYVGLTPAINPLYIEELGTGIKAAHADLFQHGLMGISAPPATSGHAIKLATDLAALLGAVPYYAAPAEIDGIMAAAHLLPQLAAVALTNAVIDQPGWPDIRKLAGRHFTLSTSLLESTGETDSLSEAAEHNRENLVRVLDSLLAALQDLRADIAAGDKKNLGSRLRHARQGREKWRQERMKGDWRSVEHGGSPDLPTGSDIMRQQLGGLGKLFRRGGKSDPD